MSLFNIESMGTELVGFRLHKLEVYNWGTFDKSVWTFNPDGKTALLTGDSGSGKSTLVDALTTLLVPPRKISYNKAADASAKERNSKSYVLGYYGRKYNLEGKGKPEALRKSNCYSVILSTFKNETTNAEVTMAIFSWFKERDSNPSKLYVVASKELSIAEDFSKFDSNVKILRDRLKAKGCNLSTDYKNYANAFRKQLGGVSEQAIDLFQQTISMKKVDALNDFVRESMIEYDNPDRMINDLLKHYENLNVAYQTVINAQNQINSLEPICKKGEEYEKKTNQKLQFERGRECNEGWFASKKKGLLVDRIGVIKDKLSEVDHSLSTSEFKGQKVEEEIIALHRAINESGGTEIERLSQEIKYLQKELNSRKANLSNYDRHLAKLDLVKINSINDFQQNQHKLNSLEQEFMAKRNLIQQENAEVAIEIQKQSNVVTELTQELESLKKRTSNIPAHLIKLRDRMCSELNIDSEYLPFVGELLEVKSADLKWEGAIERIAHNFGLSLLVSEKFYLTVAKWVNSNKLGTRLVYFNAGQVRNNVSFAIENSEAVYNKLLIKPNTQFTNWLEAEVKIRFSHTCVENIEQFKNEQKAISITGQIKSNTRHEKDDRRNLEDRSRYILGFSNKKKIETLQLNVTEIKQSLQLLNNQKEKNDTKFETLVEKLNAVYNLSEFKQYEPLDTMTIANQINQNEDKLDKLKSSNSMLQILRDQLTECQEEQSKIKLQITKLQTSKGRLETELESFENDAKTVNEIIKNIDSSDIEVHNYLQTNLKKMTGERNITLSNCDSLEKQYVNQLTNKCDRIQQRLSTLQSEIEKAMAKFRGNYPSESIELSESISGIEDYRKSYDELLYNNLPMYQQNFKDELQGKIIKHITLFSSKLNENSKRIETRIKEINESLFSIDYNAGRFIEIICERTPEVEIRNFRNQLKACSEGIYSGIDEDELAARKFKEIQNIIERFKGRPDSFEPDRRWTKRVTDVRNWFVFSASESWRDSGEEYEHYSDSDGKSGGQKEKLAYTILAASLAYNYRLRDQRYSNNSFRLVVIDEAFLKSSDESAKFGLGLFKQMNFQLLVVTPLLKIATIEPFVQHVGFVSHSDVDHRSKLQNIEKEVFKAKLLKH